MIKKCIELLQNKKFNQEDVETAQMTATELTETQQQKCKTNRSNGKSSFSKPNLEYFSNYSNNLYFVLLGLFRVPVLGSEFWRPNLKQFTAFCVFSGKLLNRSRGIGNVIHSLGNTSRIRIGDSAESKSHSCCEEIDFPRPREISDNLNFC